MSINIPSMLATILVRTGGIVFAVVGGLHATYTLMDLRVPRRLAPEDPSVTQAMASSSVKLSRGGTDMWHTWVGLNFTHSLGLLLFAAGAIWPSTRIKTLPAGVILVLTLIGCIYLVMALRYFFRGPVILVGVGTVCFACAWILLLCQSLILNT